MTKFGKNVSSETYDYEQEDEWLLDNETTTENALILDVKEVHQQPLKSASMMLKMNYLLQFGEMGVIIYPMLYTTY